MDEEDDEEYFFLSSEEFNFLVPYEERIDLLIAIPFEFFAENEFVTLH